MKRETNLWALWGFAVTALLGTLLHFLYDWFGKAWWVAPFSGVNESTWEHMKLLFWPMFLFAVVQSAFFRDRADFWCVTRNGILLGLALIPVLFYTYNGVIGKSLDFVNITIFFIAAAVAYLYQAKALRGKNARCGKWTSLALLTLLAVAFVLFTFRPPTLAVFKDPLTGAMAFSPDPCISCM